jgi:hypothetical protein
MKKNKFSVYVALFSVLLVLSDCSSEDIERIDCSSTPDVSYELEIYPILETNCIKSGCHNGDNGATRNWTVFANVQAKAELIKTKTLNKTMPLDIAPQGLPEAQIKLIACWVDQGAKDN